jgi:hypothetical protein
MRRIASAIAAFLISIIPAGAEMGGMGPGYANAVPLERPTENSNRPEKH